MRLRRIAGNDHGINDRNNGHRHEQAFVSLVRDNGLLWEAELLPRSYGGDSWFGKFAPPAGLELVASLPAITTALLRRKVTIDRRAEAAQDPVGRPRGREEDLRHRRGPRPARRAEPLHHRDRRGQRGEPRPGARQRRRRRRDDLHHEGRLLARLREPRLHARAARLDGAGRAAAGHRARRARPRELLRRRRDRRAQPGARRHAQRAHVRARAAGRRAPT